MPLLKRSQIRSRLADLTMLSRLITRIAPDVGWLPVSFANVYFVGRPGGKWVLIDAGLPGWAADIFAAAEARFGAGSRPEAIVLTHAASITQARPWRWPKCGTSQFMRTVLRFLF